MGEHIHSDLDHGWNDIPQLPFPSLPSPPLPSPPLLFTQGSVQELQSTIWHTQEQQSFHDDTCCRTTIPARTEREKSVARRAQTGIYRHAQTHRQTDRRGPDLAVQEIGRIVPAFKNSHHLLFFFLSLFFFCNSKPFLDMLALRIELVIDIKKRIRSGARLQVHQVGGSSPIEEGLAASAPGRWFESHRGGFGCSAWLSRVANLGQGSNCPKWLREWWAIGCID